MKKDNAIIEKLRPYVESLFAVDSVWSVVLRFVIWGAIALTIIASVDAVKPETQVRNLKSNLGLFLLFLVLGGVMIWLLFGFTPSL